MKKLILVCTVALFAAITVKAQNVYYVKADGTGDGSSWANAAGNIQEMIDRAAAGDRIWVAAGTYSPTAQVIVSGKSYKTFKMKDGVHLYGGFAGNETDIDSRVRSDKDMNGKTEPWEFTAETILNGNTDGVEDVWTKTTVTEGGLQNWYWTVSGNEGNSQRVVTGEDLSVETIFDGFTVEGGYNTITGYDGGGAGIYVDGAMTVNNCTVRRNMVFNHTGSTAFNNQAQGGGIMYRYLSLATEATVKNCLIADNAVQASGWTAYAHGGGIYTASYNTVSNCKVTGNSLRGIAVRGGGIYSGGSSIDACIVCNNSGFALNLGEPNVQGSGTDARGGGIYKYRGSGAIGDRTVSNCCITNNHLTAYSTNGTDICVGGGFYSGAIINSQSGFYCSTVVNNFNSSYSEEEYGLCNIIIYDNDNPLSDFIRPTSFIGAAFTGQQEAELQQADWRLKAGSEYINAGNIEDVPDDILNGTDLAGNPRTTNGKISMGAYEYTSTSAIGEIPQSANLQIFPNPVQDVLNIESGELGVETVEILDLSGKTLSVFNNSENKINVSHLSAGIYFIKIKTDKGSITRKFVKE